MFPIKKCVIPAAGLGTRFLPAAKAIPKEMLPICDKPTIQYIVEEAVQSGISEVVLIQGRGKSAIEDHFDVSYELERTLADRGRIREAEAVRRVSMMVSMVSVRQKEPLGLGHAVLAAAPIVGNEPFAVALGDDLIDAEVPGLAQLADCARRTGKGVVALMRVPEADTRLYGIAAGTRVGERELRIDQLVEKPKENPPSNLAVIGRYVLPAKTFELLGKTKPGVGGEIQLTDALAELARTDGLIGYEFEGERHDAGDRLGFLKAQVAYALKREEFREGLMDYLREVVRKS